MPDTKVEAEISAAEPAKGMIVALLEKIQVNENSNLIAVLQDVQEEFGFLPRTAITEIGNRTKTPLSRIYGVISFYAQFYTEPRGKHTILCCRGTACHVKGAKRVIDTLEQKLGIEEGQTTPDMNFYLETVACVGTCFLAPVMMIDNQYYGMLTPKKIPSILKNYQSDN